MPGRLIPQSKRPASADQPRRSRRKALLQNKCPTTIDQAERPPKKAVFAKQIPNDRRSRRATTEKSCFCKTNVQRPLLVRKPVRTSIRDWRRRYNQPVSLFRRKPESRGVAELVRNGTQWMRGGFDSDHRCRISRITRPCIRSPQAGSYPEGSSTTIVGRPRSDLGRGNVTALLRA